MNQKHPIIAREGWPFVTISLLLALAVTLWEAHWVFIALCWLIFIFILQFFRDPPRTTQAPPADIMAPADGKVIVVENTRDPYLDREATKISIFMNVFNVHSNRSPYDGTVIEKRYFKGSFVNADLDKASEHNERNALVLETPAGEKITFVQIAGLVARRILCYASEGTALKRGERYGFIRFGSRVDVYLPPNVTVKVAIGDRVTAALTTIASFKV